MQEIQLRAIFNSPGEVIVIRTEWIEGIYIREVKSVGLANG